MNTVLTDPSNAIETRRVGEYGHFVAPLSQIAADLEEFIGVPLAPYLPETSTIRRQEQGVHPEEAATLYLLVRALRPGLVLETGTFKGYSTAEIARALHKNQAGRLVTVDLDSNTGSAVPSELLPYITFHRGQSSATFAAAFPREPRVDLFFHDSLHTFMNTLGELIWFADHYAPGAIIACHDAKMDYLDDFGVGKAVRRFAAQLDLQYRVLDTTCGLAVLKWPEHPPKMPLDLLRAEFGRMERVASEGIGRRAVRKVFGF